MAFVEQRISKPILESALSHYFKAGVTIVKFEISAMMLPGKSYTSDLFRVLITYSIENCNKAEELSIVAKCFPKDEDMQILLNALKGFDQEMQIYNELLPAMYKLGNQQKCCANLIYASLQPKLLFLEDLSIDGYKLQKRELGLDLEHCLKVVGKLAYFHASSVAIYEKDPAMIEKYDKGFYCKEGIVEIGVPLAFPEFIAACERCTGLQQYVDKLKLLTDSILAKIYAVSSQKGVFNVLNHGDFWITNILFSYTHDQQLNDVAFVDFQFPLFGSPALDLHTFWATSIALDVRKYHMDFIFKHYFQELLRNLSKLNVQATPPSYQEFYEDFRFRAVYGLAGTFSNLALAKAPKRDDASVNNFLEFDREDSFGYQCFNNETYLNDVKYLLPFYDTLGVFN